MRAILTYHSIDKSGSPISCHPDAFDRHVKWMTSGRVKVTTIDELVALPPSTDAVAVTFDDAFVNFRAVAAPRLLAAGLPVTIFVVADCAGGTNAWRGRPARGVPHLPLLDWPDLIRLRQQGVVLGAHTRTHPDLTRLEPAAAENEIAGSADVIHKCGGVRPTLFAYPYGRVDAATERLVSRTFPLACTTELGVVDNLSEPLRLPRLDMYYFQDVRRLEQWGTSAFERFVKMRYLLRTVRRRAAKVREVVALRTTP